MANTVDNSLQLPETETLRLALDGCTLNITLNRPKARNAMSLKMVHELMAVFEVCRSSQSVRAIVLRGSGGHFCAGGDIKDMATARANKNQSNDDGSDPFYSLNREFGRLITQANAAPQVVIAVLEGAVLGGGFGLACVSDVAITHSDAKFGLPETGLGIPPAQIAPFVVKRVGLTQARRLALLGARFNGEEACRLGIAHYVCPDENSIEATLSDVLTQAKRCAPGANALTKSLLLRTETEALEPLLDDAARAFSKAVQGKEGQEGTMAFIQKRSPAWAE